MTVSALLAIPFMAVTAPASAEFCSLTGRTGRLEVYELSAPRCGGENRLVFDRRRDASGYQEKVETFVTDDWPWFSGGSDKNCAWGAAGAEVLAKRPGSIILGQTLFGVPQVWRFKDTCSLLRSTFLAEQGSRKAKGEKPSFEEILDAIGADRSTQGALVKELIAEGKKALGQE